MTTPDRPAPLPRAYFLSFNTYGTWLPGDPRGWIARGDAPGAPYHQPAPALERAMAARRTQPPVALDAARRAVVARAVRAECEHRGWSLHALAVLDCHVHVVVAADRSPERALNALKSWATRRMVEAGVFPQGQRAWSRHGSTLYLWRDDNVQRAVAYVDDEHHAFQTTGPG